VDVDTKKEGVLQQDIKEDISDDVKQEVHVEHVES
jgi:hypothetical protein